MIPRDPLALQRQLAELAAVEVSVRTALSRLRSTYPALARWQDDEVLEFATARVLVARCNQLLLDLNDHRAHVAFRLATLQHPEQTAWPF